VHDGAPLLRRRRDGAPRDLHSRAGADNEDKQEIDPRLLARSKVVTDLTDQAARIGDLHHAIKAGVMTSSACTRSWARSPRA
jgi:ornithine cyclodeaminase/alanine dehydrogenase-like protein (mu-crystallin family)